MVFLTVALYFEKINAETNPVYVWFMLQDDNSVMFANRNTSEWRMISFCFKLLDKLCCLQHCPLN